MLIFPELYTTRLHLRQLTADDIPELVRHASNRKISDYVLNIPHPYEEPQAVFRIGYVHQGFKERSRFVFAITLQETGQLLGEIGLHLDAGGQLAQLGYWIGEPFWKQGFASEAVAAVLRFGFGRLALAEIYATCHIDNPASGRVLEKNGLAAGKPAGNIVRYSLRNTDIQDR